MHGRLVLSLLVVILSCHPVIISGSAVVSSQWIIFDAENTTALYGNPAYTGRFGVPYLGDAEVETLSFGNNHVIALTTDGQFRGWGSTPDAYGGTLASLIPVDTWNTSSKIVSLAATDGGSVIVLEDGPAYFTGNIVPGSVNTPFGAWSMLSNTLFFKKVQCGAAHCVLQGADRKLYGFGANDVGQLSSSTANAFASVFEIPNLPQTTISSSTTIKFCTGAQHSAIMINQSLYLLGHCSALGISCIIPSRMPVILQLPNEPIHQLECGYRHTVIKTPSGVFAVGDNEVGQVDPLNPGPSIPSLTRVNLSFSSTSRILIVGNSTLGRSSGSSQGLIQAFGINGTDSEDLGFVESIIGRSEFPRPPWLRLENNDQGIGSSTRYTMGVRFVEEGTCEDPRPLAKAVCLGKENGKGRWSLQHSLQMAKNRGRSEMTLSRPLTIYGDFILEADASMNFDWPSDPDSPTLDVDGCAQIDGALSLSITSEIIASIKKDSKSKREVKLMRSQCPFFQNQKRDISVILDHQTSFNTPDSTPNGEPDVAVEPTDSAKSGESQTKSVSYQPVASSSSTSSCSKVTVTTVERTEGGLTSLIAIVSVNSSSCNTWWIITVSVVGGVILLLVIAAVIVLSTPKLRYTLLPYAGTNSG